MSSPFRGTQAVYTLGERTDGAPSIRPFSLGSILAKGVHVASYLSPYMPTFLDMHADARSLSCMATTFQKFVKTLRRSDWAESRDATPFDGTYEAADLREASSEGLPYPGTYYRSYSAYMVRNRSSEAICWSDRIQRQRQIRPPKNTIDLPFVMLCPIHPYTCFLRSWALTTSLSSNHRRQSLSTVIHTTTSVGHCGATEGRRPCGPTMVLFPCSLNGIHSTARKLNRLLVRGARR